MSNKCSGIASPDIRYYRITNPREHDNKKKIFGFPFVLCSLIRTFDLRSKVLSLGNTKINLVFRSLIRTFARANQ